jgi:hypothetical protein
MFPHCGKNRVDFSTLWKRFMGQQNERRGLIDFVAFFAGVEEVEGVGGAGGGGDGVE